MVATDGLLPHAAISFLYYFCSVPRSELSLIRLLTVLEHRTETVVAALVTHHLSLMKHVVERAKPLARFRSSLVWRHRSVLRYTRIDNGVSAVIDHHGIGLLTKHRDLTTSGRIEVWKSWIWCSEQLSIVFSQ